MTKPVITRTYRKFLTFMLIAIYCRASHATLINDLFEVAIIAFLANFFSGDE